jgi:alcohol dehydrogenase (cytochrome c)
MSGPYYAPRSELVTLTGQGLCAAHGCSSILSTDGGIIFVGEANGQFDALDAHTGDVLWQFETGNGIHSSPITYSVGGKQFVAVWSGWGGWMKGFAPKLYGAPRGAALFAFALQ